MPRPRLYPTNAARQAAWRLKQSRTLADFPCVTIGPCTLYQGDALQMVSLFPRHAAVITDPPYQTSYDWTKARRRASQWAENFVGADTPFDPTPWLQFPEVILCGASHYYQQLPPGGAWWVWDKTPGQCPSDFAPYEWIWLSMAGPPRALPFLWRGGMRAGAENYVHLPQKLHPAQKPVSLMTALLQATAAPVVIDPYMGSGSTLEACVRVGRSCIGVEIDPDYFAVARDRLQRVVEEVARQPGLFAS
jgi:site-specific DNA-methyltransferase (adenine-specific)